MIAQAIQASLLASAMAATLVGRRDSNAVSQGRRLMACILAAKAALERRPGEARQYQQTGRPLPAHLP
jgi:hypothetical protein